MPTAYDFGSPLTFSGEKNSRSGMREVARIEGGELRLYEPGRDTRPDTGFRFIVRRSRKLYLRSCEHCGEKVTEVGLVETPKGTMLETIHLCGGA